MTRSLYQDNINRAIELIYTSLNQLDLDQPIALNNVFKSTEINDYELIFRTVIVDIRQNSTITNDQKNVIYCLLCFKLYLFTSYNLSILN